MKAIVHDSYGSPDVLGLEEIDKPVIGDDQVLVRVKAASVNPLDWHFMRGTPYLVRIQAGLSRPKRKTRGADLAGQVEAVGKNVTRLQPGDEVFGDASGAFAEYVAASEKVLALKPPNLSFEEAAAAPVAGLTALQGLRDKAKIQPGHKVLINGASGGVGTFAVQIAKSFGAEVTGVCSTRNMDMVRSIGADHVIDYTQENFTQGERHYDVMLDTVGNHSLSDCKSVINPDGVYVSIGSNQMGDWIGPLTHVLRVMIASWIGSQRLVPMLATANEEDLAILAGFLDSGEVTPVIDRTYPLEETPEAIRYLEEGHVRGKVVITV
ncbi:MAG: NAD(P)-dependent alcohol dehydrogenase [Acidimicrobiia bacterium]